MYIPTGGIDGIDAGLGKDIEKNGHIRKAWSECQPKGNRQRRCDIEFKEEIGRNRSE